MQFDECVSQSVTHPNNIGPKKCVYSPTCIGYMSLSLTQVGPSRGQNTHSLLGLLADNGLPMTEQLKGPEGQVAV